MWDESMCSLLKRPSSSSQVVSTWKAAQVTLSRGWPRPGCSPSPFFPAIVFYIGIWRSLLFAKIVLSLYQMYFSVLVVIPLLRNMAWISSMLLFLWKDKWMRATTTLTKGWNLKYFANLWKVAGDLVSGTKIAVKSAPMMQSAAYNQKVPENLSGDCTCCQSQRLVDILPMEQNWNGQVLSDDVIRWRW